MDPKQIQEMETDTETETEGEELGSKDKTPTTSDEEFIDDEDAEEEGDDLQILFNEIHLLRSEVNFLRKQIENLTN